MFVNTLRRCPRHLGKVAPSYAELSKLIRSFHLKPKVEPQSQCHHSPSNYRLSRTTRRKIATSSRYSSAFDSYCKSLTFPAATKEIPDLESAPISSDEIVVHGYLGSRHDLSKNLSFVPILSRNLSHSIQAVSHARSSKDADEAHRQLKQCRPNTPVVVRGRLRARQDASSKDLGQYHKIKTREIEISSIQELNDFPADIILEPDTNCGPEQRHLQLRQEKDLRDALHFRSKLSSVCRDWFRDERGFVEIETPLLFKSTPEGAREFLVPSRKRGSVYALPQSPQQFKQILMGSGISRYFQIARCFRDEDLRADRQPEFTQLDMEMSFATGQDVMDCVEALVKKLWAAALKSPLPDEAFPRMTYGQAMAQYGSDKPDLRRGLRISRIDHLVPLDLIAKISSLCAPAVDCLHIECGGIEEDPKATGAMIRDYLDSSDGAVFRENSDGAPGVFIVDSTKPLRGLFAFGFEATEEIERLYTLDDGDLVILQARPDAPFAGGSTALGRLGLELHKVAVQNGLITSPSGTRPLWVTDFPLFSPTNASEPGQGGTAGFASTHHPFTSPKSPQDVALLATDPAKVIGDHYDLVINGVELGGGSRRIHVSEMQKYVLQDVLKMSTERLAEFSHLLEVLRAGCPPHAGIALGFDRLVAVMLGKESVRDVIAFPKSGKGEDPLVKSPGPLTEEALRTYHLKLID